ncbi:heme-binding protein [uncultured Rhodoblastus sp.]|uniref:SOUL family heme-binding protein n=1 Tax=uncultured Rhodoblastus sp. TaxID=543037 RepID=UPI002600AF70|nr:heme-binding protein [uncultured Rhodoblastus sp.]
MAIEEPKYKLSFKQGDIEIRDYQPAIAAEVTVAGERREAANKGFRLLAGYIFGGNTRRQNIDMTAPVAQQKASEKIAMTAPVTQTPEEGAWVIRFTMPSNYTLETLPEPIDPRVKLRKIAPARLAVIRFSGLAGAADVEAKTAELVAFTKARHLRAIGPASLAQYNPPWTPWFMRRNEVMIQVEN